MYLLSIYYVIGTIMDADGNSANVIGILAKIKWNESKWILSIAPHEW